VPIDPSENQREQHQKNSHGTQASIWIATLNMNGCHMSCKSRMTFKKWSKINATVKNERIAILTLQETHLDQEIVNNLHSIYKKWFDIHNSGLETAPRTFTRVAFVINQDD
jgi:exonuclease III